MSSAKISALIITYNEEKNIARCLDALVGLADEIVVVDSYSTDRTPEICRAYPKVRFLQNPFAGHIEQKNFALDQATGDYQLSLDADEVLSPELQRSIAQAKAAGFGAEAYRFNRRTHYVDRWIKHCGWYPDTKLRLVRRGTARWGGQNPHDKLIPKNPRARTVWLHGDLLHYSYASIAEHVQQTNKFTSIAAEALHRQGKRSCTWKIFTRPLLQFVRDYFFKLGFLDGKYGFVICYINGLSALLKYAKLKELQNAKSPVEASPIRSPHDS
ncbi:MAG TPA: glycosyltransferase family 2 protein [Bdellovibrionota bacterium]|jgi:glycosyltransferase involved in cell wall biosynthesis|nr:glycosyltransferase family 2 protein [Bdellovibrionota bacterium]